MHALFFDEDGARLRDNLKMPVPHDHESLIKISLAAVCNTDREIMRGYKPDFRGVLGHEFVGVVESSGDNTLIGKRVVGELNEGCGSCLYCKSGRERHCTDRKCIGIAGKDGCFAPYMTMATRLLHIVPENLPDETAIFAEPFAAALEIAEQTHIKPSEEICIIGDGRLALMIGQALSLTGARITVLGRHREKLELFSGFADTCTKPKGNYELVIEASGSPSGLKTAMQIVRSGGRIVLKSTYAGTSDANLSNLVVNEITILGSRCGPFEPALRLMSRGLLSLPPIELYNISDWQKAFQSPAFKVGFDFRV